MSFKDLLLRFLIWRMKHISDRNFVILLSVVIGLLSGLAAVVLKTTVHFIQHFLTEGFNVNFDNVLFTIYPAVGILLTVLFSHFILKETLGHGITDILFKISRKSAIIEKGKMYSRMITSALTVGFGGSVGLEAPIVVTGSAIGANVGHFVHLGYNKRIILIGCGTAGAISAIFNAPVAGVIFALEIILSDVTIVSLIPVLIASVTGSLVSMSISGNSGLINFELVDAFTQRDTPYFLLLGAFAGLVSVYFTRVMFSVERSIGKINNRMFRALLGGIGVGLFVYIFPPIYGEGYDTINALLAGGESKILNFSLFAEYNHTVVILLFSFGVILIKPVASALTLGSGGSGGVFAPSLFLGGVCGFFFATAINYFIPQADISVSNFTLVGMCAVMSGVLRAPLTAMFLIAELTGGYELFVPLMLVSAISFSTGLYFEKHSLYIKPLIERGDLIIDNRDRQVLSLINLKKIIEDDLVSIHPSATLEELAQVVKKSKRNIFPVVNEKQELEGIITLDDIREIMFDEDMRRTMIVAELMHSPPASVSSRELMDSVMLKFERTGAWNLPVIDEGKYIGFISKSRIFNAYRNKLIRRDRN